MEELYKSVEKLHTPDVKNSPRRETRYQGDPGCRNRGRHAQRCGSAVRVCTGINPYREITALARVDNAGKASSGPPLSFALHSAILLLLCVADRSCVTSVLPPPPRIWRRALCGRVRDCELCSKIPCVYRKIAESLLSLPNRKIANSEPYVYNPSKSRR